MEVDGTSLLQIQLTLLLSRIAIGIILLMNLERILYLGHLPLPGFLQLAQHGTRLDQECRL